VKNNQEKTAELHRLNNQKPDTMYETSYLQLASPLSRIASKTLPAKYETRAYTRDPPIGHPLHARILANN
jgi:hypothetical protein